MRDEYRNIERQEVDLDKIAKIVVEYYEELISSPDGTVDMYKFDPDTHMLTTQERQILQERISDVDFLFELTAPLRDVNMG